MLPQLTVAIVPLILGTISTVLAVSPTQPPSIISQPHSIVYFKKMQREEKVELPCIAEGTPTPQYRWEKNGAEFDIRQYYYIERVKGLGTLIIHRPSDEDQGYYQCFAYNSHGSTSVSIKALLTKAVHFPFPHAQPKKYWPMVSTPLTLRCNPPKSVPEASIMWATTRVGHTPKLINFDDRTTMDLEGNLHITNVMESDSRDGMAYTCISKNSILRSVVQANEDHVIIPRWSLASSKMMPVQLMWASPSDLLGLKDETVRLKCIFSGNPTPSVSWMKTGDDLDQRRMSLHSYNQELVIRSLQFEDNGQYVCSGHNGVNRITRTFSIRVEAKPFWIDEPKDQTKAVEEDASFSCKAGGVPPPRIEWFINGVSIAGVQPNQRRLVYKYRVDYSSLVMTDAQVIQCNASNVHGYLWADVFLNVLGTAPQIIEAPKMRQKVAQGHQANITCKTTAKPDPVIKWFKEYQLLTGGRYQITDEGTLHISDAQLRDSGKYRCEARNKFGKQEATGEVAVRLRTVIVSRPPVQIEADADHDIILICESVTDAKEMENMKTVWTLDGEPVDTSDPRFVVSQANFSLTVRNIEIKDAGRYRCNVSNGLDSDTATTRLIVKSVPDAPEEVIVVSCSQSSAQIQWKNASDNNSPMEKFIVEYNTTFDKDDWRVGAEVVATKTKARVALSPWANYTFRVIAKNEKGNSKPSKHSQVCITPPDRPYKNPRNVHTLTDEPHVLKIRWDMMPQIDHNGKNFEYVVIVKRKNDTEKAVEAYIFSDYKKTSMARDTEFVYEPYEIEVRARNQEGEALAGVQKVQGYSGEAAPLVKIEDFGLDESKLITATQASFKWTGVENNPKKIRGEFKGYKIQYWTTGDREGTFKEIDLRRVDTTRGRSSLRINTEEHTISGLPAFTSLTFQAVVTNTYFAGPPSNQIFLQTPEGVPSAVRSVKASLRGPHNVVITWDPPKHKNGILTGYNIAVQHIDEAVSGKTLEHQINDPEQRYFELSTLDASDSYRVYIWAKTRAWAGKKYYIDVRTPEARGPNTTETVNCSKSYLPSYLILAKLVIASRLPPEYGRISWNPFGDNCYLSPVPHTASLVPWDGFEIKEDH